MEGSGALHYFVQPSGPIDPQNPGFGDSHAVLADARTEAQRRADETRRPMDIFGSPAHGGTLKLLETVEPRT